MSNRPRVAITLGDVAGVGPEVVVRALAHDSLHRECRPVVVGSAEVMKRAAALLGKPLTFFTVDGPTFESMPMEKQGLLHTPIPCWNPSSADVSNLPAGVLDARAGAAAYDWLVAATQAALDGRVDAIVTAPLNKAALHLAGHIYPGHTEILAERCGVADFAMMLYLPPGEAVRGEFGLGVAHVTLHTSIRSVPGLLSTSAIREKIGLVDRFVRRIGCPQPRVGVCALNPHAGEQGLFGDEESTLIAPAVHQATAHRIHAIGPLPADTLLQRAVGGEFDGVVAMYHDQGHIALKLIGFHRAVNVTLGLPIVRTSPSHGTAFDIAWQGKAREDGLLEAIRIAVRLCGPAPRLEETRPVG